MKIKVMNVVGARPNYMKIAPLAEEMQKHPEFEVSLLHTGQHYDQKMSESFFDDLGMSKADIYLGVGSANHGEQTGRIMIEFEKVLLREKPDLVVVVGDVNSTIACGLVTVKQAIKFAHVEAGLRSFDRSMPEEINRILTDQIADYLFVSEKSGVENLLQEGIASERIFFVGNVMIDTLMKYLQRAHDSSILKDVGLKQKDYILLTLHRPSNVDSKPQFLEILRALAEIQRHMKIVFPIHPRSWARLSEFGLKEKIEELPGLIMMEPLGYLDFIKLMSEAKLILTDSGGIQEETTALGVPCLTLRDNTERPVTVTQGTNLLVGSKAERIIQESMRILEGESKRSTCPDLWDGKAAERIVDVLLGYFGKR